MNAQGSVQAALATRPKYLLLVPGFMVLTLLLLLPLLTILAESFHYFEPGRIGSAQGARLTVSNYTDLFRPAYLGYLGDTLRLGFLAAIFGLIIAFPIANFIARQPAGKTRTYCLGFLIAMIFLSVLVRVYAIQIALGPVGIGKPLTSLMGISPNDRLYSELLIVLGLLHHAIPLSALILVGTIQNINPRLVEAAQALGASRIFAHASVTLPLSMRGMLGAFLISYTLAISAFVVPMILGRGRVVFVSNLVYSRFGEVANYPSGSAIAILLLALSFATIWAITAIITWKWSRQ
jgi:ABC-type spermidine/putrescine transport system permease subunit I